MKNTAMKNIVTLWEVGLLIAVLADAIATDDAVDHTDFLRMSEEKSVFDHSNSMAERKGCPPTSSCSNAGGQCVKSNEVCEGELDPKGCKGRKCKCCKPAICDPPCENGKCTGPDTCTCDEGWEGTYCEIAKGCKPNSVCAVQGGHCVDQNTPCKGRLVPGSCEPEKCGDCCIPECPYGDGFFSPPGSRQCFKIFNDMGRNWTDAKEKCETEKPGLVLAHPFDAITLRSYLIQRFGWSFVWLNGRGDGQVVRWQDNNVDIPPGSPQWYSGYGEKFGTDYCLLQTGWLDTWKHGPTSPFVMYPCSDVPWLTLCELVIDYN